MALEPVPFPAGTDAETLDGRELAAFVQERAGFMVQTYKRRAVIVSADHLLGLVALVEQLRAERDENERHYVAMNDGGNDAR